MKSTRKKKSFLKEKSRTLLVFIIIYILLLFYGAYLALNNDYIKIILETILSPITIGLIFGFIDSLRRDYNEYYQNIADDYKERKKND
jgi:amino acid permease